MRRRTSIRTGAAAALAVAAVVPAAPAAAAPTLHQLVAFKDGSAEQHSVEAAKTTARVGRKRCAVPAGTALAALLRSRVKPLKLKDFGSCSRRTVDAGGLYVAAIKTDRARGIDGWVYKVGNKLATAGAGDQTGPFGNGRIKDGKRVTWFYCRLNARTRSCQRTLVAKPEALGGGMLRVTVRGYDDRARSRPAAQATVHAGDQTATTDDNGVATLTLPPGATRVYAERKGTVRSFEEAVDVR
jgi:hypothetical protein